MFSVEDIWRLLAYFQEVRGATRRLYFLAVATAHSGVEPSICAPHPELRLAAGLDDAAVARIGLIVSMRTPGEGSGGLIGAKAVLKTPNGTGINSHSVGLCWHRHGRSLITLPELMPAARSGSASLDPKRQRVGTYWRWRQEYVATKRIFLFAEQPYLNASNFVAHLMRMPKTKRHLSSFLIATGHTDMRPGRQSLALTVQESLKRDPHAGDLYIFRGRRGSGQDSLA